MGGERKFVDKLQSVFDKENYDPANEPDIAYPYLFTYFPKEAWRTQRITSKLLSKYYRNEPSGIPGNDDTGAMSAWAIFSMLGFYPDCPGSISYGLTTPTFDKVTIHLDTKYYKNPTLVIETRPVDEHTNRQHIYFDEFQIGNKLYKNTYRINHDELMNAGKITFFTKLVGGMPEITVD